MNDTQFDDFFNDKLKDHEAALPAGLWDRLKDGQFDKYVGDQLKDHIAPVPTGLWDKITDTQFDEFVGGALYNTTAPVPAGLWDKVTDGRFDSFIAGKLYDHDAAVPEGLWDKVNPQKDKDRKIGFIFFRYPAAAILILALLLGGSMGAYLFLKNQQGNNNTEQQAGNGHTQPSGNDKNTGIQAPGVDKENNTANSDANPPQSHPDAQSQSADAPAPTTEPASSKENNTFHSPKSGTVPKQYKEGSATELDEASVSATIKKGRGSKQGNGIPAEAGNGMTIHQKELATTHTAANPPLLLNPGGNTEDEGFDFIEPFHRTLLKGVTVPSATETAGFQNLADKKLSTLNHTNQFRNVIICPADKRNHNTDWFLEAYASPDLAFQSVTNKSATQQYLLTKDSSESMQISYTGGLRLVKPINDNILVKLGVQYTQANQKYVYRTENEVKTTTVVTVRTIIRAPGDTVIVHDTSTLQQIGFKNNTVKNRYRSFDIPVTLGYQFGNDDLKFGVNAGVVFNLSSWYEGVILDSSLATVTLNKTGNGVFKSNLGLGLYAGFSVTKRLSEDLHVFFEPYFRYNLSSMTTAGAKYDQKFSLGGVSLGLRLNLNRK